MHRPVPRQTGPLNPSNTHTHTHTRSSFQAITSQSSDGFSKTIPVPSRHYHHAGPETPLAGARVSLKDTFDAEGAKATLSSRAWARLYPAADASAAHVRKLLGLGAVVVGKTKTTQFAAGSGSGSGSAWVDFLPPANPRGDGYQDAGGSSPGAAASLAGYGWLDYAVGGECKLLVPCVCVCVCGLPF